MIDSHCHCEAFDDINDVLARAEDAGVTQVITISSQLESSPKLTDLCRRFPGKLFMTTGVHPEEISGLTDEVLERAILRDAQQSFCVGVGEIGLDDHQKPSEEEKARQRHFFDLQMSLAGRLGLPVSIHTRDAIEDTIAIVKNHPSVRGVFHCFCESVEIARRVLDLGYRISLSGIVTFKKATIMQEVARFIPSEALLIETDAPYLAPEPYRGKRNEPAFVAKTGEFIAQLRGLSPAVLFEQTATNTRQLFGLDKD